jgi:hypothetical protein
MIFLGAARRDVRPAEFLAAALCEDKPDMKRPITDRAEVSVDFPDKAYYGSFGRHSSYDVRADEHGLHIDLDRGSGEKRHVGFHIHYFLLADIIDAAGEALAKMKAMDESQRSALQDATGKLAKAVKKRARRRKQEKTEL